jgi:glycerophosphoryl diester phosphodiesterase
MYRLPKIFELLFAAFIFQYAGAQVLQPLPSIEHHFTVVAHRGDHEQAPENTLVAFKNAIQDGADYVEIDLRTSLDSQLIIMHDATVDRMTDGRGLVKDMTLETLRKLKVKDKAHPDWGEFQIPLFAEVLELCKNRINIYLDFKNAEPADAYREIVRYGLEKQVIVYINAEQQFYRWRKAAPDMPLMVSLPDHVRDTISMKNFLNQFHVEVLDGDYAQYAEDMIKTAEKLGCFVLPDIQGVNEGPELWTQPIQKGIKGLQTDHPVELIRYLNEKGIR